jgi:protein gp37
LLAPFAALDRRFVIQILTKRAERMRRYFSLPDRIDRIAEAGQTMGISVRTDQWPLPHFWLGVSVENQKFADERIPLLLQTPAAVRWISYEPALEAVDLVPYLDPGCSTFNRRQGASVNWVVAGGESGPRARPPHPDWFRSARDQCQAAGVGFFFKQWGQWAPLRCFGDWESWNKASAHAIVSPNGKFSSHRRNDAPDDECGLTCADLDGAAVMAWVPKRIAGHLLDGREWNEFPDVWAVREPPPDGTA